jgi:probable phosphoglycerate mutase
MARETTTRVVLVRAARTAWELEDRLVGRADLPPAPGEAQRLAALFDATPAGDLDAVVTGPGEACGLAANLLAQKAAPRRRVRVVDDLAEVDLGLWQGVLRADLCGRHPTCSKAWFTDPALVQPPEGESVSDASDRLIGAVLRSVEKARVRGGTFALVLPPLAHALVRCWLVGESPSALWRLAAEAPEGPEAFALPTAPTRLAGSRAKAS